VAGHVGVGSGRLRAGDRLSGGLQLSVEGLDVGGDAHLGIVSGGDLFCGWGRIALGEGWLREGGRKRNAAQRGHERTPSEVAHLA
jgi:hypothetical protein